MLQYILVPFSSQVSPARVAVVATCATSEPKCGSVSANAANRISPRARPPTQRSFCAGVPIILTTFCPIEPPLVQSGQPSP